jgi:hypothetical protein
MNPIDKEIVSFLNLKTYPARLDKEQAAVYLGFQPDQITVLVQRGLLKPLGKPAQNGQKFFPSVDLEELKQDKGWLSKATSAVTDYWQKKCPQSQRAITDSNQAMMQKICKLLLAPPSHLVPRPGGHEAM